MKKLRSKAGESIAEVLIASLVVVLGVLLFATMVISSFRIINKSEDTMKEFYKSESTANEMVSGTGTKASINIGSNSGLMKTGDYNPNITLYGSDEIKTYKKQ